MSELLKRLLGLMFPGVEGDEDATVDPAPETDTDLDDPDDDLEIDLDDDPAVAARPARETRNDRDDRLAKLEAEVERRGRIAAEREAAASRGPSQDQLAFEAEEQRLRDAEITEMERWQIQANRTLRQTKAQAAEALRSARDISDRSRFEAKIASDPRRAKYQDRVEAELTRARAAGGDPPREDVYFWMLGKDIADGNLKPKAKTNSGAANVNRGKSPGVRSDTSGRAGRTDADKRRARLENVNI